jgi:3-deoxy-manno-octulosonate cytidylyltransferase (CMP-KDO synthetase)
VRNERILCVIPARLGSERLPRKPLHVMAGRPLLEWVWRRVASFQLPNRVIVATDAGEVMALCGSMGAEVVLTSPAHGSGTERIAEVVRMPEYSGYDVVVNVQGDEPFVTGVAGGGGGFAGCRFRHRHGGRAGGHGGGVA